jgi:hypothetical protein
MKVTRREIAVLIAAASVPAPAQTQQVRTPGEELKLEAARIATLGSFLADFSVPMTVEPAFQFRA